jgi:hypothetical protein
LYKTKPELRTELKGYCILAVLKIPDQFTANKRWSAAFIKWLEQEVKFNTSAGNFAFQNMITQLLQIREHNKNVLKQLRVVDSG